eukprot:TRINITY_DN663_c0_g1_i3.p1 TRINITY_DN663_c0_g1~~TRINITY_DN663_c0_g1_i3.p1  ORF type:complete len:508 (+),score=81.14 TRINITY_DN663_c0_g1_i3:112-1524(+)
MDEDSLKEPDSPSSFDEKLCCDECLRENRPNGRSCICRVPKNQRRGNLGGVGCITCGCPGCHSEDADTKLEKSELDTDQPNENAESTTRSDDRSEAPLKNGCCKPCMKAFSDNSKACICQVPSYVRKAVLPPAGCSVCKCKGCHPNDIIARKRKYSGDHSDSRSQRRSSPFHRGKWVEPPRARHIFGPYVGGHGPGQGTGHGPPPPPHLPPLDGFFPPPPGFGLHPHGHPPSLRQRDESLRRRGFPAGPFILGPPQPFLRDRAGYPIDGPYFGRFPHPSHLGPPPFIPGLHLHDRRFLPPDPRDLHRNEKYFRERERGRDRDRDRDRDYYRDHHDDYYSHKDREHPRDRDKNRGERKDRDKDRERDKDRKREPHEREKDRSPKREREKERHAGGKNSPEQLDKGHSSYNSDRDRNRDKDRVTERAEVKKEPRSIFTSPEHLSSRRSSDELPYDSHKRYVSNPPSKRARER